MGFFENHKVKLGVGSVLGIPLAATGGALYLLSKQPEPTPPPIKPPIVEVDKKQDRVAQSEPDGPLAPVIITVIPDVDEIEFPDDVILHDSSDPSPAPQIETQVPATEQQMQDAITELQLEIGKLRSDVATIRTERAQLVAQIEQMKVQVKEKRAHVAQSNVQERSLSDQIEKLKKQIEHLERTTVRHDASDAH
jgi:hypothetical protein